MGASLSALCLNTELPFTLRRAPRRFLVVRAARERYGACLCVPAAQRWLGRARRLGFVRRCAARSGQGLAAWLGGSKCALPQTARSLLRCFFDCLPQRGQNRRCLQVLTAETGGWQVCSLLCIAYARLLYACLGLAAGLMAPGKRWRSGTGVPTWSLTDTLTQLFRCSAEHQTNARPLCPRSFISSGSTCLRVRVP